MVAGGGDRGEHPVVAGEVDDLLAGPGLGHKLRLGREEAEGLAGGEEEASVGAMDAKGHDLDTLGELDQDREGLTQAPAAWQALDRQRVDATVGDDDEEPVGALGREEEAR